MCKQQYVAIERTRASDNPIDPRAHLLGCLTTGTSVTEYQPARCDPVDLLGRLSFVFAVIPLRQVRVDDHVLAEACQFAGLLRALHWTAERKPGEIPGEDGPHPFRKPAAMVGQGDVGGPRVLATKAPLRLTVPDREDVHVRLLKSQTLSASVECPAVEVEAASRPHRHPVISGMSSPYRQMNSLWSMSLSRIACLA